VLDVAKFRHVYEQMHFQMGAQGVFDRTLAKLIPMLQASVLPADTGAYRGLRVITVSSIDSGAGSVYRKSDCFLLGRVIARLRTTRARAASCCQRLPSPYPI
jgi:hypothetical protein